MTGYIGKATSSQSESMAIIARAEVESKIGAVPGEIVSFDPATQTATIKPLYSMPVNGKSLPMPELLDVPVRFARAGAGGVTYPVKAGNRVTLRPMMKSTEAYHGGGDNETTDARFSSLSDMEASLDGGEGLGDAIPNFDASNMHIRFNESGSFGLKGSPDGKVSLTGSDGDIYDLLVQVVELLASDELNIKYGSSLGAGHELSNKAQYQTIAAQLRAMVLS